MAHEDETLLRVLRGYRQAFDEENPDMSSAERDDRFRQIWNRIGTKLSGNPAATPLPPSLVPQKRPASTTSHFGLESTSKRAVPAYTSPSAPYLERRTSAPAGLSPTMTSKPLNPRNAGTKTKPINIIRQSARPGRRPSASVSSQPTPSAINKQYNGAEPVRNMAFVDFLGQSPGSGVQSTPSFAFTAPEAGHGEWHAPDMALYAMTSSQYDGTYSPVTATSDSCLTSASTAFSEPMSRCNTNDQICEPFGMFNMEPSLASFPDDSMRSMAKPTYPVTFSDVSHVDLSHLSFPQTIPRYQSLSLSSAMKPSLSQASGSSSSSDFSSSHSPMLPNFQQAQAKPRVLAPKKQDDASEQPPMPRLVAIKGEDGTIKHKAEIARTTRQPQQRKTTFCDFCNYQPQGFHGDHELRRHIERQHTQYRKVWICRDVSEDGTFLRNCKACRNNKTYGANYNAAAHLRRTHFNPCKNKRGGRGKKSEGRGGMGGGNTPSMEELKKWMYETYEVNVHGRVIVQNVAPDSTMPSVPMAELVAFDQAPQPKADNLEFDVDPGMLDNMSADDTMYSMGNYQQPIMQSYQVRPTTTHLQGQFVRRKPLSAEDLQVAPAYMR